MTEVNEVANFLVRSLQQVDPRPLKGSELAVLIKTAYPDFSAESYGCRTLREFIRRNASEIMELSRAGMDIVYQLRSTHEKLMAEGTTIADSSGLTDQLIHDPLVWKTFASPDSAFRLYIDPQTEIVRSLHYSAKPPVGWQQIPKISAEVLLQIGRDFTAALPDFQKSALAPLLQEQKWWIPYYERLQALGLRTKWIEFRRRRIREEFHRVISEAIAVEHRPEVNPSGKPRGPESAGIHPESPIRKIAVDVVQRMTESELRSLNLPLGYVIDCLTTR